MNFHSRLPSSSSASYIPLHKTQLHPRMLHPFSLSRPLSNPTKSNHHKHLLLIICLALLPFLLYLLHLYRSLHLPSSSSFGVIIDVSHSHTQIVVFQSLNEVSGTPFDGDTSDSMRAQQGLSGSDPNAVSRVVVKLLEFAKKKVPSSEWKVTKVQLMVTVSGEDGVNGVLEECRKVLRSSGFLFRDDWASILGGQDEGLYNWLAVNYALGYIGNKPQETAGVIVLGKSAMQLSFASSEPPISEVPRAIRLSGVPYYLYTQSLEQLGQDAIWGLLHQQKSQELRSLSQKNENAESSPCLPRGYELTSHASDRKLVKSYGVGNFSVCKYEIMTLLKGRQGKCAGTPCELNASIMNELEKKPHHHQRFFLTSELQGLVTKASASDMEAAGQHFCEDDEETLKRPYNIDNIDQSSSCFSHAFVSVLLQKSFGIPLDDRRVEFAAGSIQVDWKFGAFLSRSITEPFDSQIEDQHTQIIRNEYPTYLLLFAVVLVFVFLATFFVMKLQKPQYKTIYDLEKGHYIVSRVPR